MCWKGTASERAPLLWIPSGITGTMATTSAERKQCGRASDEESRGTAASADQLWMVWSPQCWHNGPGSAHSQNINRLTQPRLKTMELILQLFRAVRKRLSDLEAHQSLFKSYLRWQLTLWTWCVGGSWTSRWWHPLLSPRTLWTPHAAQERAPSNTGR